MLITRLSARLCKHEIRFLQNLQQSHETPRPLALIVSLLAPIALLQPAYGRGCDGGACLVCKNCRYCKHCAKEGGTCDVCTPPKKAGTTGKSSSKPKRKSKAKSTKQRKR